MRQMESLVRGRLLAAVCVASFICFMSVHSMQAQQPTGAASIAGTVVDSRGAALAHAAVTVKNQATGATAQTTTNSLGQFVLPGLDEGRYTLTASASGFADAIQKNLPASAQPAKITVALNVGSVAQNIEVRAIAGDSIAAQHALSQATLDAETPKSEIGSEFIQEFTPPTTDYAEIVNIAPGTISYNP